MLYGNEIGNNALAELQYFFTGNLKSLELGDLKFKDRLLEHQGLNLLSLDRLRYLTIKGIAITHQATFSKIKAYIEADNVFLRELNLSWTFMTHRHVLEILDLII